MNIDVENFTALDLEALVIGLLMHLNLAVYNPDLSIAENVENAIAND